MMDFATFSGSFSDFVLLGLTHITDFEGYDHMLFLLALCGVYGLKNWKLVLALITVFTLGHSSTILLGGMSIVRVNSAIIEWLIPITIAITALWNFFSKKDKTSVVPKLALCLIIGFIHGLGFSGFVRMFVAEDEVVSGLLSFNLGVEVGQVLVVTAILGLHHVAVKWIRIPQKFWIWGISGFALVISLVLTIQNWPF